MGFADKMGKVVEASKARAASAKARVQRLESPEHAASELADRVAEMDDVLSAYLEIAENPMENAPVSADWTYRDKSDKTSKSTGSLVKTEARARLTAVHKALDATIRATNRIRKATGQPN